MDGITFRSMWLEDIEQISEIEEESFPTPWSSEAFYNELVNNQFAYYMVMEHAGKIIGYGGMWTIVGEAHITNIAIRKSYRGKKLGKKLLQCMLKTAVLLGMKRITLEVRVSNIAAQKLYSYFKFQSTGIRKGYYTDNCEDAVIMWAELDEAMQMCDGEEVKDGTAAGIDAEHEAGTVAGTNADYEAEAGEAVAEAEAEAKAKAETEAEAETGEAVAEAEAEAKAKAETEAVHLFLSLDKEGKRGSC